MTGLRSISSIKGRAVGRWPAAHAVEERRALELTDQFQRLVGVDRDRGEGDVAQDFDVNAAEPDHQHRAKGRVARDAEDDLMTSRRHGLHQDTLDCGVRARRLRARQHPLVAVAHSGVARNAEDYGAGLGLVEDVGRLHFERDGAAYPPGGRHGFFGTRYNGFRRAGDAVSREQCLGFGFGKHRPRGGERAIHFDAYRRRGRGCRFPLAPPGLECSVVDQRPDRASTTRHRSIARDAGLGESRHRSLGRGRVGRQQDRLLGRASDLGQLLGTRLRGRLVGK
jgi:hypothetical protein